ncbi:hypothetical protein SLINC_4638 [Streptomyces lincolnensis]|uniref:Uncharacterized protein n=1 Tax=Streptomyces lincolnensis TaxID=1915 RepID=A0A1B1MEP7_STRLN|nr:hypothetical protein [Streptomyces lincolnensis]ANS66862.1 hypothetical protein SLINC_4638 [Streptomyces lincolnensis]AXG55733.1 hypothetical protein SLCG_4578 [Streptomyces lincolnensis]QMV07779.1 hypothetical protein GJU35_20310 [Streptomyces lincolnensis]
MAKTGYGKRLTGDEDPHADADFAHLSPRDREIAVFVDHLDEGHAMGYKAIAAVHPRYGQQAVRTSLGRITLAGHLRWIKEHITVEDDSMRWVTRTYWSRTRRSVEWWEDFARERHGKDVTEDHMPGLARVEDIEEAVSAVEQPEAEEPVEQPSGAYRTLADLRSVDPRMPLSDGDCRSLEALAQEWLSRGATALDITRALTDGLPPTVANPGGLARNRLENKMPPKKAKIRQKAARRAHVSRVIMACGLCGADERTTEIVSGLCRECIELIEAEGPAYGAVPDTFLPGPRGGSALPGADEVIDVTERVEALRRAAGLR